MEFGALASGRSDLSAVLAVVVPLFAASDDGRVHREGVFVSYRREDADQPAGRLSDRLAERFGRGNVFIDIASIPAGVDFGEMLRYALDKCGVLLAVIGPNWLSSASDGRRRLDDPDDWVLREISTALARGIRVVPILINGADMPPPDRPAGGSRSTRTAQRGSHRLRDLRTGRRCSVG